MGFEPVEGREALAVVVVNECDESEAEAPPPVSCRVAATRRPDSDEEDVDVDEGVVGTRGAPRALFVARDACSCSCAADDAEAEEEADAEADAEEVAEEEEVTGSALPRPRGPAWEPMRERMKAAEAEPEGIMFSEEDNAEDDDDEVELVAVRPPEVPPAFADACPFCIMTWAWTSYRCSASL